MKPVWICLSAVLAIASCGTAPESTLRLVSVPERAPAVVSAADAAGPPAAPAVIAPRPEAPVAAPIAEPRRAGMIAPFSEAIIEAGQGYGVRVAPERSQARAEKAAREWAPDARQIFVGWGYWKKPWISFVRHGFYSPSLDKALMIDVALTKWAMRKKEEPGENYRDAAQMVQEAEDRYRYSAPLAVEVAKREGYEPQRVHVAALVKMSLHGPFWVIVDDRDWSPAMVIHAETGHVSKTGPMVEAARFLMGSSKEEAEPSPTPAPSEPPDDGLPLL